MSIKPKSITYVSLKEVQELAKDHLGERYSQILWDLYFIKVFLGVDGNPVLLNKKDIDSVHKDLWDLIQESLESDEYKDNLVVMNTREEK